MTSDLGSRREPVVTVRKSVRHPSVGSGGRVAVLANKVLRVDGPSAEARRAACGQHGSERTPSTQGSVLTPLPLGESEGGPQRRPLLRGLCWGSLRVGSPELVGRPTPRGGPHSSRLCPRLRRGLGPCCLRSPSDGVCAAERRPLTSHSAFCFHRSRRSLYVGSVVSTGFNKDTT